MTAPHTQKDLRARPPTPDDGVHYPDARDVLPVESMYHFVPQAYMQTALEIWFADDPTMLVAAEMFIYYQPSDIRECAAPDVYVIPNVGNALRHSYFMWLEGEVPLFAIEIASRSTYRRDLAHKQELYESWGVAEYWRYDPEGTRLRPLLQGYRLAAGRYQPLPVAVDAASGRCVGHSPVLQLELHAGLEWFRFLNPATGEFISNRQEAEQERQAAERERLAAEQQRLLAEQRRLTAEQRRFAAEQRRLAAEQALEQEQAARQELERLLRQHGIAPPGGAI